MKIRLSTIDDVSSIITIINDAKNLLASLKIDQWQNEYPNATQIKNDIQNKESYVVVNDENEIIASAMFTTNKESSYQAIEGKWLVSASKQYGVIHRLAIRKAYRKRGVAKFIFTEFRQQLRNKNIRSIKIDTHEDNFIMQSLIKKLGYQYCGVIYTNYGAKRLAFEKLII